MDSFSCSYFCLDRFAPAHDSLVPCRGPPAWQVCRTWLARRANFLRRSLVALTVLAFEFYPSSRGIRAKIGIWFRAQVWSDPSLTWWFWGRRQLWRTCSEIHWRLSWALEIHLCWFGAIRKTDCYASNLRHRRSRRDYANPYLSVASFATVRANVSSFSFRNRSCLRRCLAVYQGWNS